MVPFALDVIYILEATADDSFLSNQAQIHRFGDAGKRSHRWIHDHGSKTRSHAAGFKLSNGCANKD